MTDSQSVRQVDPETSTASGLGLLVDRLQTIDFGLGLGDRVGQLVEAASPWIK
jgi:hypothetical protein